MQGILTFCGALILCVYWQSWKDVTHLVYDIPSAVIMCAYLSQILCEGFAGLLSRSWWMRVLLVIPMSVIPFGREFLGWRISGHLSDMWAVALIQSLDGRLYRWERLIYWGPVPIVLWIRLSRFDVGGHWETFNALIAGTLMFMLYAGLIFLPPDTRKSGGFCEESDG